MEKRSIRRSAHAAFEFGFALVPSRRPYLFCRVGEIRLMIARRPAHPTNKEHRPGRPSAPNGTGTG
jgi:hypothetical protein